MDSINPGELRDKVVFLKFSKTPNDNGGTTAKLIEYLSTWAKIQPLKARFGIEAAKPVLKQPHRVIIRFRKEQEPKVDMLMKWNGQTFLVNDITDKDTQKSLIELTVSAQ
jgi:SPP1 family predicted phage head-tail adaptor